MNRLDNILATMQIEIDELKKKLSLLSRGINKKESSNFLSSANRIPVCGETYYIDSNGDAYFKNLTADSINGEISSIIEQAPGLTRKYKWYQTTETWVSIYYSDDGGETGQDSGQGWDFS
jgi:hypothetical protein